MSEEKIEFSLETPEADAADDYTDRRGDEPFTLPVEANDADAAEQHVRVRGSWERWPDSIPVEANEADAAEQHFSDSLDEDDDDYR